MSEIFQLFECGDVFQFTDPADSYATWQGLRGPKGDKGDTGATGPGLDMQGPVATTGDLPATAPSNELWLVGAAAPYHGWFYNGARWEDAGEIAIGPEGPPGQDGADGAAATIAVGTVSGLPAGSTPTVTNTGTSAAAVFDFGIPAGADGQTGPAGPGVAAGGSAGQYLIKQSATDFDAAWETRANIVNPNLLDNWYFVGGGTGTYGVFPVNQRGQGSYSTANAFTIDRWKLTSGSLTVVSGGITLNGTIVQTLPAAIGQTFIASALLSDGTIISPTYNDSTKTFTLTAAGETIVAVKLEAGSVQTLAHLESGIWVLNEVPHFVEQLLQCQTNDPFYNSKGLTTSVGTIQAGGYYRLGRLVVLSVRISLSTALSGDTIVLEGCPLPLASSYNFVVVSSNYPYFSNNFLNTSGQVRLSGSLGAGNVLMLYTSYIGQ